MKTLRNIKTYLAIIFFIFIIAVFFGSTAEAASYRINPGATVTIDRHENCRTVTNPTGHPAIFVPVLISQEWLYFRLWAPSHIVIEGCVVVILDNPLASCAVACNNIDRSCVSVGIDDAATNGTVVTWCEPYIPGLGMPWYHDNITCSAIFCPMDIWAFCWELNSIDGVIHWNCRCH